MIDIKTDSGTIYSTDIITFKHTIAILNLKYMSNDSLSSKINQKYI